MVLHRATSSAARTRPVGRPPIRLRIRHLPRRARLVPTRRGLSHLAITDETGEPFHYAQRVEIGPQVDRSPRRTRRCTDWLRPHRSPAAIPTDPVDARWTGVADGRARTAGTTCGRHCRPWRRRSPAYRPSTSACASRAGNQPALHDRDGWIDFGPAGSSYYYSRTSMAAEGSLLLGGSTYRGRRRRLVRPSVGRFHQRRRWRLGLVRRQPRGRHRPDAVAGPRRGRVLSRWSTARSSTPHGSTRHLERDAFTVTATRQWTSPTTGATYPGGAGRSRSPASDSSSTSSRRSPTRSSTPAPSTGVVYWEGSQIVSGASGGRAQLTGEAYVELTGYGPAGVAP